MTVAYAAAYGLPSIPIAVFVLREHRLPWLWDLFPMYGGPWWDAMTDEEFVATLGAFLAVNSVVAAGGVLLWFGRRAGAVIALAPLPIEFAFWLGYALPFPPLIALLRIALVAAAWHQTTVLIRGPCGPREVRKQCEVIDVENSFPLMGSGF